MSPEERASAEKAVKAMQELLVESERRHDPWNVFVTVWIREELASLCADMVAVKP